MDIENAYALCYTKNMDNRFENMTKEQLWKLFPIFLTKHNPDWADWYKEEDENLRALLGTNDAMRISHIGSTAIDKLWAKPIIDILIETPDKTALERVCETLIKADYILMAKTSDRYSFNKGYTPKGLDDKVYHIHLRLKGDNDELYFRDYLATHDNVAWEYEKLKLKLWRKYTYDRDAYTAAKTDFVVKYTNIAKQLYKDRYTI